MISWFLLLRLDDHGKGWVYDKEKTTCVYNFPSITPE